MVLRMTSVAAMLAVLGACSSMPGFLGGATPPASNPLDDVERLSEVGVSPDADAVAIAAPQSETGGFFSGLMSAFSGGAAPETTQDDAVVGALAEATGQEVETIPAAAGTTEQGGGLGRLFGLGDAPATVAAPVERTGPDAQLVPFGTRIPFGEIATVCDAPSNLGTKIAGVSGYEIYDSIPNSTAARPHYITGFADGCARQFTAALSLMGDVGTHEVVRYNPVNNSQPYSDTDNAYEGIKASFCRVSHGTPCGARLDSLAANTTFLSVYERFGTNGKWFEILLHGGQVAAVAIEDH